MLILYNKSDYIPVIAWGRNARYCKNIGVGDNIQAYTTYRQAKFMEMDKDMYYSYLLSFRSFILVVLPRAVDDTSTEADESLYPKQDNLMFQAVYSGVSPYSGTGWR